MTSIKWEIGERVIIGKDMSYGMEKYAGEEGTILHLVLSGYEKYKDKIVWVRLDKIKGAFKDNTFATSIEHLIKVNNRNLLGHLMKD
jgi:hypothetical protein